MSNYILKEALRAIATDGADDNGRVAGYSAAQLRDIAQGALKNHEAIEKQDAEKHAQLMEIGKKAYASIAEMVAALNCDYDRLAELRQDRDDWNKRYEEGNEQTDYANGSLDAEELAELEKDAGDCESREDAEQRIHEDPLSIEVRGDWCTLGESAGKPTEFKILLATGGPAVRICGELDAYGQPTRAYLQVQDWFTPWTDYTDVDSDLLTYASQFYFGE